MEEQNRNLKAQWYIIQCISNHEDKVREALENKKRTEDLDEIIYEVFLPKVFKEAKSGSKKKRPLFPGYIFVKMVMTDEAWYIVRNTQDVTGIVGSSGQRTKPTPITQRDIDRMLKKMEASQEGAVVQRTDKQAEVEHEFKVGDSVKITEGPFEGNFSTIEEIDGIKQAATVKLEVFGKLTKTVIPFAYLRLI